MRSQALAETAGVILGLESERMRPDVFLMKSETELLINEHEVRLSRDWGRDGSMRAG